MFFNDDISWCYNSVEENKETKIYCNKTKCFRHISNYKPQSFPAIFTVAAFKGTIDCPYFEEGEIE